MNIKRAREALEYGKTLETQLRKRAKAAEAQVAQLREGGNALLACVDDNEWPNDCEAFRVAIKGTP